MSSPAFSQNQELALHQQLGESHDVGSADLRIHLELSAKRLHNGLEGAGSIRQLDDPLGNQRSFARFVLEDMQQIPGSDRQESVSHPLHPRVGVDPDCALKTGFVHSAVILLRKYVL